MLTMMYIYNMAFQLVIKYVDKVPVTVFLNEKGHDNLTRICLIYLLTGSGMAIGYAFFNKNLASMHSLDVWVTNFKIGHHIDLRKNKENLYDFKILNDLDNGKELIVREIDRFTGTLVNGQSGTGKTSTIFTTSIGEDLLKKLKNLEGIKKELNEMVVGRKLKLKPGIVEPLTHAKEFDVNAFEPIGKNPAEIKKNSKEYQELLEKFPNCGITAIAPNDGLPGDVIKLCSKLNLCLNVVDPMPDEITGQYKENYTGINPFWVNDNLSEYEKIVDISEKATMFAEIMAAINDESGSTDVYFADINKSVTVNIAIVNMVAIPGIFHRQADIFDMQRCINDFSALEELVKYMEDRYGSVTIKESVKKEKTRKQRNNTAEDEDAKERRNENIVKVNRSEEISFEVENNTYTKSVVDTATKNEQESEKHKTSDITSQINQMSNNPFYMVIFFVKQELLGGGAEKMIDQSRGLRNQINNFLLNPHINRVFSYKKRVLDFDRMFREGEVTVVNTALQLGDSQSKAFGLYFILLFRQAMFRRPKATRNVRHWCYIDELPVYLHPRLESIYSLARQYRCGFYSAIQTLDQMEKNATTKYLKGVLMGAGTHIVFGRVNNSEMRLYAELAGMKLAEHVKSSESGSNILEEGSYGHSETSELKSESIMEGYQIRNRDFTELTFFTSDRGRVLDVKNAKAHFINLDKFENIERTQYDWLIDNKKGTFPKQASPAEFVQEYKQETNTEEDFVAITPNDIAADFNIAVSKDAAESELDIMPEPVVTGPYIESPTIQVQEEVTDDFDIDYDAKADETKNIVITNRTEKVRSAYDILSQLYDK